MTGIQKAAFLFSQRTIDNKSLTVYLTFIFFLAFSYRLFIFANIEVFAFSDFQSYYRAAFKIAEGTSYPLKIGTFTFANAYLGAFFMKYFGSIDYWFYFNIFLAVTVILLQWSIVKKVTGHSGIANLTILFCSVYTVFAVIPSIFYTQIIMLFFLILILILLAIAYERTNPVVTSVCLILISVIVPFSFLFKAELRFLYMLMLLTGIIQLLMRFRREALLSMATAFLILLSTNIAQGVFPVFHDYMHTRSPNEFVFFGHTPYGGGEGQMLPEYETQYAQGLEKFRKEHADEYKSEIWLENRYRKDLMRRYIKEHPFGWLKLQVKKFFRTFGIKPEGMSFRIIVGKMFMGHSLLAGAYLSLPFLIMFISLIFLADIDLLKRMLNAPYRIFLVLLFGYYIAATIFYGHFQTRYRLPLDIVFLTPTFASLLVIHIKNIGLRKAIRKHLMVKIIIFSIFVSAWTYEFYDIFVLNRDRYIGHAKLYEKGIMDLPSRPSPDIP
jgi:hypothetical protein